MSPVRRRVGMGTLLLLALLAQTAFFPHVRPWGVVPDVMVLAVAAVAVREGAEIGAVFGFAAGVLIDLFLEVPVGLSAFAYAVVGYGVGMVQTGLLRPQWWMSPAIGGTASLVAGLIFVLAAMILGQEYLFSVRTFVVIPARAAYDALLAIAVFPVASRLMGPADETVAPYQR